MYCIISGRGKVDKRHSAADRRSLGICVACRRASYNYQHEKSRDDVSDPCFRMTKDGGISDLHSSSSPKRGLAKPSD